MFKAETFRRYYAILRSQFTVEGHLPMVIIEKTLFKQDSGALVVTSEGTLLLLIFEEPLPSGYDISMFTGLPLDNGPVEMDDIPYPVYHAEIHPMGIPSLQSLDV